MQLDDLPCAAARPSRSTLAVKRAFDVVASGAAIVLLLPLFVIVAAAIKLDGPGPVFFRQTRVGQGGRHFRVFKFRSMIDGASREGTALTVHADPRITRVGAFLRDRKIDEVPQLFNVFVGNMSFVGPRPEVPEYMEFYTTEQRDIILSMRPGITDYAAILFRNESAVLEGESNPVDAYKHRIMPIKFALYKRYSHDIGLIADLRLILGTLSLLTFSNDLGCAAAARNFTVAASPGMSESHEPENETLQKIN